MINTYELQFPHLYNRAMIDNSHNFYEDTRGLMHKICALRGGGGCPSAQTAPLVVWEALGDV